MNAGERRGCGTDGQTERTDGQIAILTSDQQTSSCPIKKTLEDYFLEIALYIIPLAFSPIACWFRTLSVKIKSVKMDNI